MGCRLGSKRLRRVNSSTQIAENTFCSTEFNSDGV